VTSSWIPEINKSAHRKKCVQRKRHMNARTVTRIALKAHKFLHPICTKIRLSVGWRIVMTAVSQHTSLHDGHHYKRSCHSSCIAQTFLDFTFLTYRKRIETLRFSSIFFVTDVRCLLSAVMTAAGRLIDCQKVENFITPRDGRNDGHYATLKPSSPVMMRARV